MCERQILRKKARRMKVGSKLWYSLSSYLGDLVERARFGELLCEEIRFYKSLLDLAHQK